MIALLLSLASAGSLPVRTVELPADLARPILVHCPRDQTTRIVLPERVSRLTASAGAKDSLGLTVEQYSPFGILTVRPASHPESGRVVVRGASRTLVLQLESSASGVASEIRFTLPTVAEPAAESAAEPVAQPSASPARMASDEPAARTAAIPADASRAPEVEPDAAAAKQPEAFGEPPAARAPVGRALQSGTERAPLDLEGLLAAQPVRIDRREGLPGQKQVVLADALKGDKWVWFRFVVRGGADEHVARVLMGDLPVETHTAQPEGKDLKVVVQLPRGEVGRKSRIRLTLASGASYTFPLTSSSFTAFLKGLFR